MTFPKIWSMQHAEAASNQLRESKKWNFLRRKSFDSFSSLPFPNFKYGLDIRPDISGLDWNTFLFDSQNKKPFFKDLGNGAFMCDFSTAFEKFPQMLETHLCQQLDLNEKLESLHSAFLSRGILVYIPSNVKMTSPISVPISIGKYSQIDHLLVIAEENSSVSLLQETSSLISTNSTPIFHSSAVEIVAAPHASVHFGALQDLPSENIFHFSIARAKVEEKASVKLEWGEFGAQYSKSDYAVTHLGAHALSSNAGVVLGSHSQCFDISQSSFHRVPLTQSTLLARGCLDAQSKCIYHGLIRMEKEAISSQGKQACDFLLLSSGAEADPVPSLEILNSDVKCSHSATVGRIDKEKLFYIASRGVSEEVARKMVITGYYENVLSHFSTQELKTKCQSILEQRLGLSNNAFADVEPNAMDEVRV